MGRFLNLWARLKAKSDGTTPTFPRGGMAQWAQFMGTRTSIDFAREVGRAQDNSIVEICLGWICDSWPDAPIGVWRDDPSAGTSVMVPHAMSELLRRPNPYYGARVLWQATISDLKVNSGNAYWHVLRNSFGVPVQAYWMPAENVEPKWDIGDTSSYISHYEYSPDGRPVRLEVDEVLHFREGMDPGNTRKGYARLKSGLPEIFTDNEAALAVSVMLRNRGQMSMSISPKPHKDGDKMPQLKSDDAAMLEAKITAKVGDDNRGRLMVHSIPVDIVQFGAQLSDLASRELRRIPEERICALFRIPPGVVKVGAGLDRNTYSNAKTEQEQAWSNCIKPLHGLICDELFAKLLPMFGNPTGLIVKPDYSDVQALQADQTELAGRLVSLFQGDAIWRSELRAELNYPVEPARDDVFWSETVGGVGEVQRAVQEDAKASSHRRREMFETLGIAEEDA